MKPQNQHQDTYGYYVLWYLENQMMFFNYGRDTEAMCEDFIVQYSNNTGALYALAAINECCTLMGSVLKKLKLPAAENLTSPMFLQTIDIWEEKIKANNKKLKIEQKQAFQSILDTIYLQIRI